MRNLTVVFVGALALLACSKNQPPPEATTQTRGATSEQQPQMVSTEEIRTMLLNKRPSAADQINGLVITNDSGVITLRGSVDDEATHADIVNRVRSMPNVRSVRDEIQVMPRQGTGGPSSMGPGQSGTTTTTGSQMGGSQMGGSQMGGSQQGTMGGTQQGTMGGSQQGTMGGTQQGTMGGTQQGTMGGAQQGTMGGTQQGGTQGGATISKSDQVRQAMEASRPKSTDVIEQLSITDDGSGVVTVNGTVPDETTHKALIKAAKDTPGVARVKDEVKVHKAKTTPKTNQ